VSEAQVFDPSLAMFKVAGGGLGLKAVTIPIEHQGIRFYIQTARSTRIQSLALHAIGEPVLHLAMWMGTVSLLVFGAAVYVTLCYRLRPLRDASDAAADIEPRNLSARLATRELPTEVAPLVDAFNLALDRLEKGYRVQQEFLAGAAHELKTPLALIRAQIEMDGATDRASLLRDVDMMARQVHQLLHLAEVSESQNYVYEPCDPAAVASDVTSYLSRLADRRQVSLRVLGDAAGTRLNADRSALFVLLKNLAENAIHHSPNGGVVTVAVDSEGLLVRDQGEGIAPGDSAKLFERFWRSAKRRDEGAGLGLAICREIALAHGWHLSAHNAERGAVFKLAFRPA
jgi:signal transduction histidine kinase